MYFMFTTGIAILVSVMIVVFVASFNDYQKEKQFKALQDQQVAAHDVRHTHASGQTKDS
jgi:hypothetical protein